MGNAYNVSWRYIGTRCPGTDFFLKKHAIKVECSLNFHLLFYTFHLLFYSLPFLERSLVAIICVWVLCWNIWLKLTESSNNMLQNKYMGLAIRCLCICLSLETDFGKMTSSLMFLLPQSLLPLSTCLVLLFVHMAILMLGTLYGY